jgi:hypothetical protein
MATETPRMKFRYPAFAVGLPAGHTRPKPCVVIRETEFDPPDLSEADAPLALVLRDLTNFHGTRTVVEIAYRHHAGSLFTRSNQRLSDFEGGSSRFAGDPDIYRPFQSSFFDIKSDAWPQGIANRRTELVKHLAGHNGMLPENVVMKMESPQEVTFDDAGLRDLEFFEAIARATLGRFVTVDGEVWEHAEEPALVIDRPIDGPFGIETAPRQKCRQARNLGGGRFLSVKGAEPLLSDSRLRWPEVAIMLPDALAKDFDAENLCMLARHAVDSMRSTRMPAPVLAAWRELAHVVRNLDPFEHLAETERLVDELFETAAAYGRERFYDSKDLAVMDRARSARDGRMIEVEEVAAFPPRP